MDKPEVLEHLAEVRMAELAESVAIIGYQNLDLLGYLDSGMPDTEANADPRNFANAPLDEAVEKLVRIIRRDRPQVIITYSDDQGGYPHPDHLKVHEISLPAFDRAGDPAWYPESGEPWTPLKLYYTVWSRARIVAVHEKMIEMGIESPYNDDWFNRPNQDDRITTRVFIGDQFAVRGRALRAHATQVDPTSPFWFGLSDEMQADLYPWDEYVLAESRVETALPEDDLFAGVPGR
jgi:mycothiol S-conjugate amidase